MFNSAEFNTILFNGEAGINQYLTAFIVGSSTCTINNVTITRPVYLYANIDGVSSVSANATVTNTAGMLIIDGSSSLDVIKTSRTIKLRAEFYGTEDTSITGLSIGKFAKAYILDSSSSLSVNYTTTYSPQVFINGRSTMSANLSGEFLINASIDSSSSLEILKTYETMRIGTVNIDGSTDVISSCGIFDMAGQLNIDCSSSVEATATMIWSPSINIDGSSDVISNAGITYRSFATLHIDGSSSCKLPFYIASSGLQYSETYDKTLDKVYINGVSYVKATLTSDDKIKTTGSRRRVSYSFQVEDPSYSNDEINKHFRIWKFYNSLRHVKQTLQYVNTNATNELQNYLSAVEDSTGYWFNENSLTSVTNGDIKYVGTNATGIFLNKDNQIGLYIGPSLSDNT